MRESLEERYEYYRRILEGLTIMSDMFMRNVLKDRACTEYILRIILEDPGLTVPEQALQMDYKNLYCRSATMYWGMICRSIIYEKRSMNWGKTFGMKCLSFM